MEKKPSLWIEHLLNYKSAYDDFVLYCEKAERGLVDSIMKFAANGALSEMQAASIELRAYRKIKQTVVAEYREQVSRLAREGKEQ